MFTSRLTCSRILLTIAVNWAKSLSALRCLKITIIKKGSGSGREGINFFCIEILRRNRSLLGKLPKH